MRLSRLKMSGFKSFVDPTTIHYPSARVSIVGPNGCGKSNIIDAVRWVMGETSRHLRGDTMEDVIFNGSSARKPVGQASIELVFDNSDGAVGGHYAQYNEIAIRRQVSRDGQSSYFLNGTKCRRRDITDIFLGTGLGPRSYAIIEQGMISRLIEAKPEELRVLLEEAAGISHYKERRRETENRIRHTRDNIDRLQDLRDALDKQLNHLKRQAKTAEQYQALKAQERRTSAELLALRWYAQEQESTARQTALNETQTRLEQITAELRGFEAEIEQRRQSHSEATEAFNEIQGQYYRIGGDISRTEQSIQHAEESQQRQQQELAQNEQALNTARHELATARDRARQLSAELAQREPELEHLRAEQARLEGCLQTAEQAMAAWQREWEDLGRRQAEPHETAQVERTRREHLQSQIDQLEKRESRLLEEQAGLAGEAAAAEIDALRTRVEAAGAEADNLQNEVQATLEAIEARRQQNRTLGGELDEAKAAAQQLRGRRVSLEALQETALGKHDAELTEWLQDRQLDKAPRLAEQIRVHPGWEAAVETVLGDDLQAVCVDDLAAHSRSLAATRPGGGVALFDARGDTSEDEIISSNYLVKRIESALPLQGLVRGVYGAVDVDEALAWRPALTAGESVVTRQGLWLGPNWSRVANDKDAYAGVLERAQELEVVAGQLATADQHSEQLSQRRQAGEDELTMLETRREDLQTRYNQAQRAHTEAQTRLNDQQRQWEQQQARAAQVTEELAEIQAGLARDRPALQTADSRRSQALAQLETLADEREGLEARRAERVHEHEQARNQVQQARDSAHQAALKIESMRASLEATREGLQRMAQHDQSLQQRRETLQALLQEAAAPLETQQAELQTLLSQRIEIEQSLGSARQHMQTIEAELRDLEHQRVTTEGRIEQLRSELEDQRLVWQEVSVRCQTLKEQVLDTGFALDALLQEMAAEAEVDQWQAELDKLTQRIERLGPINLAAIDEYEEHSQRKAYLDSQYGDLTEALQTLESAIHKIDKETRARFRETFEQVSGRLQEMFPRLFGGGQAHLDMTGEDLLSTGVAIMARPPGKRLSTIHLMSGGEKALTAVALVFAIFELNPAPFCMLDEVDAPLDEANVARFCELVRELSKRVQFIFITHNKMTMEFSESLVGVTMNEPGVSRLVAVDVDEAARMATG